MKVLILHSYYQLRGGEDAVFEQEAKLLSEINQVKKISYDNKSGLKGAVQFFLSICNIVLGQQLKKEIRLFKPDIIHLHNIHFALGPIAIRIAKKEGVPIVMTLHNYRLLCPSATLLANGKLFTNSVHAKFPWVAIKKKVYRQSTIQTFWLALIIWFHKKIGTWKMVNQYIVLTSFAKDLFIHSSFGVSGNHFVIKPNFVNRPKFGEHQIRNNDFLFVGRLSEEKGIMVLLEAFKSTDLKLKIIGDGPLKEKVESYCFLNKNVLYLGKLDIDSVQTEMQKCSALIVSSIWYEPFGLVTIEALASGTPVIASNLGATASIIQDGYNGLHFKVSDNSSLKSQIDKWNKMSFEDKSLYEKNAFETYFKYYTPEVNLHSLQDIYQSVT